MNSLVYFTLFLSTCLADETNTNNNKFPKKFLFGCSTSAYQIEGGWNADGKGPSNWDNITHTSPYLITDGSNADVACDSYHRYEEDVANLKALGVHFYRFSISWSRVLPTGFTDNINELGVAYYKNLIQELKHNHIEPMVTILHGDIPQALQDFKGLLNTSFPIWYAGYAKFCFEQFGDDVKYWLTINEPYIQCTEGSSFWNFTDGIDNYICMKNLLLAHAHGWHIYHDELQGTGKVAMVLDSDYYEPGSDSPEDLEAAERTVQFTLGWCAHPIYIGDYPEIMKIRIANRSKLEGFNQSRIQELTDEEIAFVKGTNDYFALNTYTTSLVRSIPEAAIGKPSLSYDLGTEEYQSDEWIGSVVSWLKVTPWGMRKLLDWIKNEYGNPAVMITENGYADGDIELNDTIRCDYIRDYLSNVLDAMIYDDVNVMGYSQWSLMDNFEWALGYTAKYGLYSVDFADPNRTRTRKKSSYYYEKIIKTRLLLDKC